MQKDVKRNRENKETSRYRNFSIPDDVAFMILRSLLSFVVVSSPTVAFSLSGEHENGGIVKQKTSIARMHGERTL